MQAVGFPFVVIHFWEVLSPFQISAPLQGWRHDRVAISDSTPMFTAFRNLHLRGQVLQVLQPTKLSSTSACSPQVPLIKTKPCFAAGVL